MPDQHYLSLIQFAKQSLREGDRVSAKKTARFITTHYPNELEGWLLLAGLSDPLASLKYLQRAQELAPNDPRVEAALNWALERAEKPSPEAQEPTKPVQSHPSQSELKHLPAPARLQQRDPLWIWVLAAILTATLIFFGLSALPPLAGILQSQHAAASNLSWAKPTLVPSPSATNTIPGADTTPESSIVTPLTTPMPTSTLTWTPTPTVVPNLFGCEMELIFTSGPLAGDGVTFQVLDESYFYDKGDKFDVGKNTAIYYQEERLIILHSGYTDGSLTKPLEAEFIRKYLEGWGDEDLAAIEEQIEDFIGSDLVWFCNDSLAMQTQLSSIVRLSHDASTRLWLEPHNLEEIIAERSGDPDEWIGEIDLKNPKTVRLEFCGWGPPDIREGRSIYYRYLLNFQILN